MDPRRLSAGDWIAAASGLLLAVSLFLNWYSGASGWEAFSIADIVFALAALMALAASVAAAARRTHASSIAMRSLSMLVCLPALLLILYRTIDPPGSGGVDRELGAWLGLVGMLGCVGGVFRAMRDEGPPRRDPETEARAAAAALEHTELLSLSGSGRPGSGTA
jgi:drug/metabolite transporter (DMT)-like permease